MNRVLLFDYSTLSCAGMISKSQGQILRVSASMYTLFSLECEELCSTITIDAIDAAIHFVEVRYQQTAYIAGRGELDKELNLIVQGILPLSTIKNTCVAYLHDNREFNI